MSRYLHFREMCWPSADQGDLEWTLRYGSEEEIIKQRYVIASVVAAYVELINKPSKQRSKIASTIKFWREESSDG